MYSLLGSTDKMSRYYYALGAFHSKKLVEKCLNQVCIESGDTSKDMSDLMCFEQASVLVRPFKTPNCS